VTASISLRQVASPRPHPLPIQESGKQAVWWNDYQSSITRPSTRDIHAAGLRRRGMTWAAIGRAIKVTGSRARDVSLRAERWLRECEELP